MEVAQDGGMPFGDTVLDLPREPFDLTEVGSQIASSPALDDDAVRQALSGVIRERPFEEIFGGASSVMIVVSDGTRSTGASQFLPHLVKMILNAGARSLSFAVASGLHRVPTSDEVRSILGAGIAGSYPVIIHDPDDDARLVDLGKTTAGTPVKINSALLEHDRTVLTGAVGFHYYAGFSGGRKAVVPGMASRETITRNHLRAVGRDGSRHPDARAGRLDRNPVHRDMTEGAAMVNPSFLVNTVMRPEGGIERLFAGHWRDAHLAACRYLRSTRSVQVEPRKLAVVSAGGHPSDLNLIQAHKAFEGAVASITPGGVLVLVAACEEGGGDHDFMSAFDQPGEDSLLRLLMKEYRVYRQTALAWRNKLAGCRLIMISRLDPETVRKVGAIPARDLGEAFNIALRWIPRGTEGWIIRHGSRLLVRAPERVE